ncbi:UbiA family prenyltransferase [Massilia sp. W12]|uniref:UbiA family prenyltransferase n=1 Tax=Massilia sp. W12 TaxID=3126507 RepID=UPI0030CD5F54
MSTPIPTTTQAPDLPLCVDLDGTLLLTDVLLESALLLIKRNPLWLCMMLFWLLRGKAHLKAQIARRVRLDAASLPRQSDFYAWLCAQKAAGRTLWLCTASHHIPAQQIADACGIFDGVLATQEKNLAGANKAQALLARFGERGFDYCGNAKVDLAIWRVARQAIVVNASPALTRAAQAIAPALQSFPYPRNRATALMRALRLHQWVKNLLVLVPLLAAHKFHDSQLLLQAGLAFLAFSLCASSVYLLNDMLDLNADRQHPRKRKRPFASGQLSLLWGFATAPLLLLASALLCLLLPLQFALILAAYYVLTLAYSFHLKRLVMIDAISLAGLYTIRIVAGAAAVDVPLSFWLLVFSVFLFLSLALVKRYCELDGMRRQGKLHAAGRGYVTDDLSILHSMGMAAGYICVLVLALYINSPAIAMLYKRPSLIWLLCVLLLYWISRVWILAHRGLLHDDPVVFALKDRASLALAASGAAIVLAASW